MSKKPKLKTEKTYKDPVILQKQDKVATQKVNIALCFVNSDKTKLVTQVREVNLLSSENKAETALNELIKGPDLSKDPSLKPTLTSSVKVLKVEQSENIVTVNLNQEYKKLSGKDALIARLSIVNTLTELDGIKYVSLFVDGQELGFNGKPFGPMTEYIGDINTLWNSLQQSGSQNSSKDSIDLITGRGNAALYFADKTSTYLIPEVRKINSDSDDTSYINTIITELAKGPNDDTKLSVLPQDLKLIDVPETKKLKNGKTQIVLNFDGSFEDYLNENRKKQMMAVGSIVESITGVMPDVDYIEVLINGKPVQQLISDFPIKQDDLTRDNFDSYVGDRILLFFANHDNSVLVPVYRAIAKQDVIYESKRLEELFKGPLSGEDKDARPILMTPLSMSSDVAEITVDNDTVSINFTLSFQKKCQGLNATAERMFVYSVVNTMTQLPSVKKVQFYISGKKVDTLSGNISIREPLIKNPGLIKEDQSNY